MPRLFSISSKSSPGPAPLSSGPSMPKPRNRTPRGCHAQPAGKSQRPREGRRNEERWAYLPLAESWPWIYAEPADRRNSEEGSARRGLWAIPLSGSCIRLGSVARFTVRAAHRSRGGGPPAEISVTRLLTTSRSRCKMPRPLDPALHRREDRVDQSGR